MESERHANGPQSQPSAEELAILALLAQGLTDDVAARRLGLAKRTYRRRLDGVLAKLGATSRFQAGALANHRGWISFSDGCERGDGSYSPPADEGAEPGSWNNGRPNGTKGA